MSTNSNSLSPNPMFKRIYGTQYAAELRCAGLGFMAGIKAAPGGDLPPLKLIHNTIAEWASRGKRWAAEPFCEKHLKRVEAHGDASSQLRPSIVVASVDSQVIPFDVPPDILHDDHNDFEEANPFDVHEFESDPHEYFSPRGFDSP